MGNGKLLISSEADKISYARDPAKNKALIRFPANNPRI